MAFGFSVGDCIAIGKLVASTISCLHEVGGSRSDFQLLTCELECLEQALHRLETMEASQRSPQLDSIRCAALSCRRPLETFLQKLQKYQRSLGQSSKLEDIRSAGRKVQFALWEKDEVMKFRSYLSVHIGTINVMLAEHGFEKMDFIANETAATRDMIKESLDEARHTSSRLHQSLLSQIDCIENASSVLGRLLGVLSHDIRSSLASIATTVAKICTYSQQMYNLLQEIRANVLIAPDTKWSFFQAPAMLEDALGRKLPVPSEYDLDILRAIISTRFLRGPGSVEVSNGDYELFYAEGSEKTLSCGTALRPGSSITMVVVIPQTLSFATAATRKRRQSPVELGMVCNRNIAEELNDPQQVGPLLLKPRVPEWPTTKTISTSFKNVRYSHDLSAPWAWVNSKRSAAQPGAITMENKDPRLRPALIYLDSVKLSLIDEPLTYRQVVDLLSLFNAGKLSPHDLIERMDVLLCEYPSLTRGFVKLLLIECGASYTHPAPNIGELGPDVVRGHLEDVVEDMENGVIDRLETLQQLESTLTDEQSTIPSPEAHPSSDEDDQDCIAYRNLMRAAFGDSWPTCHQAVDILRDYQNGVASRHDAFTRAEVLISQHPAFLKKFGQFYLPPALESWPAEEIKHESR
ncbi:uncharacterized protein JN550_001534 [Neoarthrinium moseri]|uniref:uncharacterized protein n=1 Tax=Neoarthrinium moseri TaxID=1658444 RepID=UPI001FDD6243|nr:uncharacterized protein JN550_001534 [Neoarthrinium moseri]KAI1876038.1 hypothetical protein JN550_001534 [Neoarthrinium moseri]